MQATHLAKFSQKSIAKTLMLCYNDNIALLTSCGLILCAKRPSGINQGYFKRITKIL